MKITYCSFPCSRAPQGVFLVSRVIQDTALEGHPFCFEDSQKAWLEFTSPPVIWLVFAFCCICSFCTEKQQSKQVELPEEVLLWVALLYHKHNWYRAKCKNSTWILNHSHIFVSQSEQDPNSAFPLRGNKDRRGGNNWAARLQESLH